MAAQGLIIPCDEVEVFVVHVEWRGGGGGGGGGGGLLLSWAVTVETTSPLSEGFSCFG